MVARIPNHVSDLSAGPSTFDGLTPWCRPLLRWAGSKRSLLNVLLGHVPRDFTRYVEPFAGSACLFFALRPSNAVLADLNNDLIETYRTLRSHPHRVARTAHAWPASKDAYYSVRELVPERLSAVERAARFIYLNRFSFNGVYRTDRHNRFNVPFGRATGAMPAAPIFTRCAYALRRADVVVGDFERTIASLGPGDYVYLDPPYTQSPRGNYGVYGYGSFEAADLPRLVLALKRIDAAGARFLLSYRCVPELDAVASSWHVRRLGVYAQVSGNAAYRRQREEVLITNFAP